MGVGVEVGLSNCRLPTTPTVNSQRGWLSLSFGKLSRFYAFEQIEQLATSRNAADKARITTKHENAASSSTSPSR